MLSWCFVIQPEQQLQGFNHNKKSQTIKPFTTKVLQRRVTKMSSSCPSELDDEMIDSLAL